VEKRIQNVNNIKDILLKPPESKNEKAT